MERRCGAFKDGTWSAKWGVVLMESSIRNGGDRVIDCGLIIVSVKGWNN